MKTVKKIAVCAVAALAAAAGRSFAEEPVDPTVPHEAIAERLRTQIAESPELAMRALVIGADDDGVALVGADAASARIARKGGVVSVPVDGVRVDVEIRSVSPSGVELGASSDGKSVFLPGSHKPLPAPAEPAAELLRYLECQEVPIDALMRLVSDQTGVNISTSEATKQKTVSIFLRNVTADVAVEEICRTAGLWFHRDRSRGVIRVTTMEEFGENLDSFREETTEMFTLLYPNVVEVASVIYGLYPDRTFLSLGEDEFNEDDEYDLARRFRRFRVLEDNGGSQFLDMEPPQASTSSSGSSSGNFSFSRGNAAGRITQWDQLRRRRRFASRGAEAIASGYDSAAILDRAKQSGDTNLEAKVVAQMSAAAPNIFVTLSRRNNSLVVRTSDPNVMDEVRRIVEKFDVPTPMVLMEVKVLELDVTDGYQAGFTWNLTSPDRGNGVSTHSIGHAGDGVRNITAGAMQTGMNALNPTFHFGIVSDYITSQIELMQKDGKVRTLATPTLLVANNEVSRIFSGKEYPIVTGWTAGESVTSDGGIVTTPSTVEIERKDVGTMLLLTPNINADKTVTIRLLQENSDVAPDRVDIPVTGSTSSEGDVRSIEYVESRQITGTFVAKDGMSVIAGGLIREKEEEMYWRTPVLGSLPLLGWLFRGTEKSKRRTELVILIKPHVISTPVEGGRISRELMEALSAHPARDGRPSMEIFQGEGDRPHNIKDDAVNVVE